MPRFVVFSTALLLGCSVGWATVLKKVEISGEDFPRAICNDGSPGVFYQATAENGTSAPWLIFLQGGGWCYDEVSCAARWTLSKSLMSSTGFQDTVSLGGIFSDESPTAGWNLVYVRYCSSDGWSGSRAASEESYGYAFRGQDIVRATFLTLVRDFGLGSSSGTRVLFGGASAGGRGAMFNIDTIAAELSSLLSEGAVSEVLGFFDSPFWMDKAPNDESLTSLMDQTTSIQELANSTDERVLDSTCAAAYPSDTWKCLFGQYRLPFVEAKYMVVAQRFDSFQLGQDMVSTPPSTQEELQYAESFGNQTHAFLSTIPSRATPGACVYSQACYNHAVSAGSSFFSLTTDDGVSESEALRQWLRDPSQTLHFVDDCSSFGCGSGCEGFFVSNVRYAA